MGPGFFETRLLVFDPKALDFFTFLLPLLELDFVRGALIGAILSSHSGFRSEIMKVWAY